MEFMEFVDNLLPIEESQTTNKELIEQFCKANKITQSEFAKRLGISISYLSKIKYNSTIVAPVVQERLEAVGLHLDYSYQGCTSTCLREKNAQLEQENRKLKEKVEAAEALLKAYSADVLAELIAKKVRAKLKVRKVFIIVDCCDCDSDDPSILFVSADEGKAKQFFDGEISKFEDGRSDYVSSCKEIVPGYFYYECTSGDGTPHRVIKLVSYEI